MSNLHDGLGGENSLHVEISTDSDAYQNYLSALKRREHIREENGGDTSEGLELVRNAVAKLNEASLQKFRNERSN